MQIRPDSDGPGLQAFKARQEKQSKLFGKMAQAKRITSAADDASGLAMARELEKQVRGLNQGNNALQDGMAALRIADGASGSISEMLQRQRELALQSSNGTLNDDQRQALDVEYQALSREIDRTTKATTYNRQGLLDGQSPLSDGTGSQNAGSGNPGDAISWRQTDLSSSALGLDDQSIATAAGAHAALSRTDEAMNRVYASRTQDGALSNRMEHAAQNAQTQAVNQADAQSRLEDLDMARAASELAREQVLGGAAQRAQAMYQAVARSNMGAVLPGLTS